VTTDNEDLVETIDNIVRQSDNVFDVQRIQASQVGSQAFVDVKIETSEGLSTPRHERWKNGFDETTQESLIYNSEILTRDYSYIVMFHIVAAGLKRRTVASQFPGRQVPFKPNLYREALRPISMMTIQKSTRVVQHASWSTNAYAQQ
jgi:hypothetical protein